MINEELRTELIGMRAEDARVRQELMDSGQLGGAYVTRMEEVHKRNAARLRELINTHGWPGEHLAGKEGAEAAWFITQHAVGEPDFQRAALLQLRSCIAEHHAPPWHAAYLEDRIALQEGRPQRYGTQWMDDSRDGRIRPWKLAEEGKVNEFRAEVGLAPLRPMPELGPELDPARRDEIQRDQRWWEDWFVSKGWRDQIA